jgi:hypothetical protein
LHLQTALAGLGRQANVIVVLTRLRGLLFVQRLHPPGHALQTLEAFQPLLDFGAAQDAASRLGLYHELLDAIASHRVGDRPDRYEPRLKKRRRNNYDWLTKPRAEMKRKMAQGLIVI